MMNDVHLTPSEKKSILNDIDSLTSMADIDIKYYKEVSNWEPGFSDNEEDSSSWSEYSKYKATPKRITKFNISKYDFGNIEEGDIVLMLPRDTTLPKYRHKYQFKFDNRVLTATTPPQPFIIFDDSVAYYILLGER